MVAVVLIGWGIGQYPYLVAPGLTIRSAAAPEATLRPLAWALAAGALVLFPSLFFLLRVFKRREVWGEGGDQPATEDGAPNGGRTSASPSSFRQ
jgi:cytochrome bd-type quinol oxidase subunit 2